MKCKYCKREIELVGNLWSDGSNDLPLICGSFDHPDPMTVIRRHAPEDSTLSTADEIERLIKEAYKTLDEIKRLTEQLKERK